MRAAAGFAALLMITPVAVRAADIVVDPRGTVRTITEALAMAKAGDRIIIRAGTYREPTLFVRVPRLTIEGIGWPELDGEEQRSVLIIEADGVEIRGLVIQRTGMASLEDRAGVRVRNAGGCRIEANRFRDNLFAIYLERATDCVVRGNDITGTGRTQGTNGNGIHLWYSPGARIENNRIVRHRDGIYFEFSSGGVTRGNLSERNGRYGLHFMYSDSCRYERNEFRDNHSGVAVMYSRGITIRGNRFEHSVGPAAYGLLLKEILGGEIAANVFANNSTGVFLEGSSHLDIRDNDFVQNGWAARVLAGAMDNRFTGNRFVGNAFDVATNSRTSNSTFTGNWWDAYRGYDLDRDGVGDVPFYPVRLFALVVEQHPESLVLLRSPLVAILDAAERVLPVLTPAALVDRKPLMRSPR